MASKDERRRIVEGYANSGMTRREYCAKHNMSVSTLDYWRSLTSPPPAGPPTRADSPWVGQTLTLIWYSWF
jgi:transposase-like protein